MVQRIVFEEICSLWIGPIFQNLGCTLPHKVKVLPSLPGSEYFALPKITFSRDKNLYFSFEFEHFRMSC